MQDLHNAFKVVSALDAIVVNDDTEGTGAAIDLQGYEGAELIVNCGISGDTLSGSVKYDLVLKECDTSGGTYTAVAQADVVGGTVTSGVFATVDDAAEDPAVFRIGYIGSKRYIKLFVDTTGTHTNGTPMAAVALLGVGRHMPPAKPAV